MRARLMALALVAVVGIAGTAVAGEKIFILKNGRKVQGELEEEKGANYIIKTAGGGRTTLAKNLVARIEDVVPRDDPFKKPPPSPEPEEPTPAPRKKEPETPVAPVASATKPAVAPVKTATTTAPVSTGYVPVTSSAMRSSVAALSKQIVAGGDIDDALATFKSLGADGALALIEVMIEDAQVRARHTQLVGHLISIIDDRSGPALVALIKVGKDASLTNEVVEVLMRARSFLAVPELATLFNADDATLAEHALKATVKTFTTDATEKKRPGYNEAVAAVRGALKVEKLRERAQRAYVTVVLYAEPKSLESLAPEDPDDPGQAPFLTGLSTRVVKGFETDLRLVERVVRMPLNAQTPKVRAAAAALSGRAKVWDSVPRLIELLADEDRDVLAATTLALKQISGGANYARIEEWQKWWEQVKNEPH